MIGLVVEESDDEGDYLGKDDYFVLDKNMDFTEWSAEVNRETEPQRKKDPRVVTRDFQRRRTNCANCVYQIEAHRDGITYH